MTMTRPKAIVLACFTAWPVLYMFLFFCAMVVMVLTQVLHSSSDGGMPTIFKIIFPLHFLTITEMFGLIAFYVWHVFKTDGITQDKKALWAVVIFMGNMVAMPVYWYLYIWKPLTSHAAKADSVTATGEAGS